MHIRFCISGRDDPSYAILEQLLADFPHVDAQILAEDEDVLLNSGRNPLGPNPKIRNMSRAYREAIGDILWIIDCNVWVAKGVCGRMVGTLDGRGLSRRYKFVHQLPLVVDVAGAPLGTTSKGHLNGALTPNLHANSNHDVHLEEPDRTAWSIGGGRLEETFMSSSHAKFYTAINTVLIAPCIVGKSTMFRRSHLNSLTNDEGIDYFSENICEDHLIGDLLWKKQVPEERRGEKVGKHAMCFGDLVVQPISNMSLSEYWKRRVRWLRVRKFTVTLATLVEPGTESFLCSLYGAFAMTTLPFFHNVFSIPNTWMAFGLVWLLSVSIWCIVDWKLFLKLHSASSIEVDDNTPSFSHQSDDVRRRSFSAWLFAWLARETLAFPIWFWAFYGGTEVEWRGKKFWVGMDMKVHAIPLEQRKEPVDRDMNGKTRID